MMLDSEIAQLVELKKEHPECKVLGCADSLNEGKFILFKFKKVTYKASIKPIGWKARCIITDLHENVCYEQTYARNAFPFLLKTIEEFIKD